MKILQEITEWPDNTPNHIYILSDKNKLVGYIKEGETEVNKLSGNIAFDKSRRKFTELLNENLLKQFEEPKSNNQKWDVKGSKGNMYVVEKEGNKYTCTCTGFNFRGDCKHIQEVLLNV